MIIALYATFVNKTDPTTNVVFKALKGFWSMQRNFDHEAHA